MRRLLLCTGAGFNIALAAWSEQWHSVVGWTIVGLFCIGALTLDDSSI